MTAPFDNDTPAPAAAAPVGAAPEVAEQLRRQTAPSRSTTVEGYPAGATQQAGPSHHDHLRHPTYSNSGRATPDLVEAFPLPADGRSLDVIIVGAGRPA